MSKKLKEVIKRTLQGYLVYIIVFGILIYVTPEHPSEEFIDRISPENFYGSDNTISIDRVRLIETPNDAVNTRMYLFNNVKETLDIAYYVTFWGETTESFFASILDAADRGVKVRILFDGIFHNLRNDARNIYYAFLQHPNIELKLYEPLNLLKPWSWNSRLHDKYIICDNQLLLLGGRNIGDKYYAPESYTGHISYDRDVLVYRTNLDEKSVVDDVTDYFNLLWDSKYVKEPTLYSINKRNQGESTRNILKEKHKDLMSSYVKEKVNLDLYTLTVPTKKVSFIYNPIHSGKKESWCAYQIYQLLLNAKDRVVMQSPYTIPDETMLQVFKQVGNQVDDFTLLTNSAYSSPNYPAFAGYQLRRDQLIDTGMDIFEFQSEHSIHAKSFIIDNDLSIVGSFNLDPRSTYIDTENMLVIHSEEFTKSLDQAIKEYKDRSLIVNKGGSYQESEKVESGNLSQKKKIIFKLMTPISRLLEFLL